MSFVAVVSDTGPLHYLVLLEQVELLNRFFGEILVPSIVLAELNHERTPIAVRDFIRSKPSWLKECFTPPLDPRYSQLGSGEQAALTVALSQPGCLLLTDDGAARRAAVADQILVSGTLGILRDAAVLGLVDIRIEIQKLKERTNFRGTNKLFEALIKQVDGLK
jgi:predicted nucleic acid-binding protein